MRRDVSPTLPAADRVRGRSNDCAGHPGRRIDAGGEGTRARRRTGWGPGLTQRRSPTLLLSGVGPNLSMSCSLRRAAYFEQACPRAGRAPAAFASASDMYLPALVVP